MYDRVTLLLAGKSSSRDWTHISENRKVVRVPALSMLEPALDNGIHQLGIEVSAVILDQSVTSEQYLAFLSNLPADFLGDVVTINQDCTGFLSAATSTGGRMLYQLGSEDLDFYMSVRFTDSLTTSADGVSSTSSQQLRSSRGTYMLSAQAPDQVQQPAEAEPDGDDRPLVLIVDDQKMEHTIARRSLADEFRVITANDGVEGFALAKAHHPDVVITDALMPRLDGRELCRYIKHYPPTCHIKVVVMTALYKSTSHEDEAHREFGADAYLRKPVSAEVLRETVRGLLDTRVQEQVAL